MLRQLQALPAAAALGIEVLDVDADAGTRQRYGHKIPVLLLGGELVCHGHFDRDEVFKALAVLRPPV
jgi:thioredoxin reductase (NADPH)